MTNPNQAILKLIRALHDLSKDELNSLIAIMNSERSRSALVETLKSLKNLHEYSDPLQLEIDPLDSSDSPKAISSIKQPKNLSLKQLRSTLYDFASDRRNFPSNQDLIDAIQRDFNIIEIPKLTSKESRARIVTFLWKHLNSLPPEDLSKRLRYFVQKHGSSDSDYQLLFNLLSKRE